MEMHLLLCSLLFQLYSFLLGSSGLVHDLPERHHIITLCAYRDLERNKIWTPERQITGNYSEETNT